MIIDIIGRFHPVLVHLPIGILLFAVLLQWLTANEKFEFVEAVIPIAYLAGFVAAIASCITGWCLAEGGEYDESTLLLHRWMGIVVAVFSGLSYELSGMNNKKLTRYLGLVMALLLTITGHLGGTLTHGDGYLTKALSVSTKDSALSQKNISNAQEAIVYADIIAPALQQKCFGCHAASKQKGGLRLDSKEWILKGGKDGSILKAGNANGSELYHRVVLDPLEEKHMPPKGKPQLSEREIVLLQWWINSGADFEKQAKTMEQSPQIKQALAVLEKNVMPVSHENNLPKEAVEEAPIAVLDGLRSKGITILPVAMNSHYLTASCVNLKTLDAQTSDWLFSLNKQLLWLKMPGMQLKESEWLKLANCTQLRSLSLAHSNISNNAVAALKALLELNYLNLVGTKIAATSLIELKGLNKLQEIFLAETRMPASDILMLKKAFTKTTIDTGGYVLPMLTTDTQLVKKK